MLSHDNVMWTAEVLDFVYHMVPDDVVLRFVGYHTNNILTIFYSYLPLSHVAAQVADIYGPLMRGNKVYFAPPDALKVWKEQAFNARNETMHLVGLFISRPAQSSLRQFSSSKCSYLIY